MSAEDTTAERPFLLVMLDDNANITNSIISVEVEDNDRLVDKATIVLHDAGRVAADAVRPGQRVTIEMGWQPERSRAVIFEGTVQATPGEAGRSRPTHTQLIAYDRSYAMNRDRVVPRSHTGALRDIIWAVAAKYADHFNIGDVLVDPNPEFTDAKPLRQRNESDLQFLYRLAALYGARAFCEYEGARSAFYFVSLPKLLSQELDVMLHYCQGFSELIDFKYNHNPSYAQPQRSSIATDPLSGQALPAPDPPPPAPAPAVRPDPELLAELDRRNEGAKYRQSLELSARASIHPEDLRHHYAVRGLPSDPNRVEEITRQDPTRVLGLTCDGVCVGNVKLRAKGKIQISGLPDWVGGEWYVNKVTHRLTQGQIKREFTPQTFRSSFAATR